MTKYFYTRKKNSQVTMFSDSSINFDKKIFQENKMNVTQDILNQISANESVFLKNNKFEFVAYQKTPQDIRQEIKTLKIKLENNQITENEALKTLLDNLI